jgi:hypothetical protein
VVESELILLGTDYDNEGKPIAYLGRSEARRSYDLRFAGTAYLSLTGEARHELQTLIKKLSTAKSAIELPRARQPQWVRPELVVRVRHLAGGDTLRHATIKGLVRND